ncbi:MAG TPA: protein kinase [Gemmatimonadales bacterium]|nr:protein kinase [Gemmatimonadales bacterium]
MNTCSKCGAELQAGARMCGKCGAEITAPFTRTAAGAPGAPAARPSHQESDDPELGQVQRFLASVYKVERVLGRGVRTVVYRAAEINPPRPVAVKVLPTAAGGAQAAARFKEEARASMALNHPNIVPVYRVGLRAGAPYFIAMKLVEGRALDAILDSQGALPLPAILLVLRAATAALDYAHGQGTNHGDLKAGNILVDRDGRVMVSDFGIARTIREVTGAAAGAGRVGDAAAGGPPNDQYALGVVALQMITGSVPSDADLPNSVRDVRSSREGLPEALVRVVQTALARDPGQRYASAADMLSAIKAIPFTDADRRDAYAVLGQLVRGEPVPRIRVAPLPPRAGVGIPGRTTQFKAPSAAAATTATMPPPAPRPVSPAPAAPVTRAVPRVPAAPLQPAATAAPSPPAAKAEPPAPPARTAPPAPAAQAPAAARTAPHAPPPAAKTAPPMPAATRPAPHVEEEPEAEPAEPAAKAPPAAKTGPFASIVRPTARQSRTSGATARSATPEPDLAESPGLWSAPPAPPPPAPAARAPRVTPQPWTDHGVLSTPPIPYPKRPSRALPLLAAGIAVVAVAGGVYWLVTRGPAPTKVAQVPARAPAPAPAAPAPRPPAAAVPAAPEGARADTAHKLPVASSGAQLDTTLATDKTGQLLLYAVPSSAEITVDDELSGSGGFVDSEVTAGRRHLQISAPGYAKLDTFVTVRPGGTLNLGRMALRSTGAAPAPEAAPAAPTTGRIRLRTVPPTAEIFVDGQSVGVGALVDFEVTSGQRQLRISAPGFVTLDTLITVDPGATVRLGQVSLQTAPGGQ